MNPTDCPSSGVFVETDPYNAKGRPMNLATCPTCGHTFRANGRATRRQLPTHATR
jgi:hypothetical protein